MGQPLGLNHNHDDDQSERLFYDHDNSAGTTSSVERGAFDQGTRFRAGSFFLLAASHQTRATSPRARAKLSTAGCTWASLAVG